MILDEPTGGLDPQQMVELRKVIRGLSVEATVLLSSHNLTEVAETCDRLLILHEGTIVAEGDQDSLSQRMDTTQQTIDVVVSKKTDIEERLLKVSQIQTFSMTEDDEHITVHCTIDCPTARPHCENGTRRFCHSSSDPHSLNWNRFLSLTGGAQ